MSIPSLLDKADHVHISEREADGSWEDCTWDGGLEFYRACYDAKRPATHTEAQLLRKASGEPPTGGSNQSNFRDGVKARYGRLLPLPKAGFANLWADLDPRGTGASVQGSMKAFGPTHRLSRFDRNFDAPHNVFVARVDDTDRVWWCDPEAPNPPGPSYQGEWVTKAELKKFVDAFAGQYLVAPLTSRPQEADMPPLTSYIPGFTANIRPLQNVRSAPSGSATLLRTIPPKQPEAVVMTGTVKGSVDPANGLDVWYTWWKNGRWEYTAKDNVADLTPPKGNAPADCSAQDAEVTRLNGVVESQAAIIASQKTAIAEAPATERARIAAAEAARIDAI